MPSSRFVFFVKWYTQRTTALIYTGPITVPKSEATRAIHPMLLSQMKLRPDDSLVIFAEEDSTLHRARRLYDSLPWSSSLLENGSLIVVQPSRPLSDEIFGQFAGGAADDALSYFAVMEIPPPPTFEGYLRSVDTLTDVRISRFETLELVFEIRVPPIDLRDLSDFLGRLGVDCSPPAAVLFFDTHPDTRLPSRRPLERLPRNPQSLFYLIVPDRASVLHSRTVIVRFSADGYRVTARRALFLSDGFSAERAIKGVAELVPLGRQVRVLLITDHQIEAVYPPNKRFTSFEHPKQAVGVAVVPEDQADARPEELVQVVHVEIDAAQYLKPVGFPFLLRVAPEETLEGLRDALKERLQFGDELMGRYRFVAFAGGGYRAITHLVFDPKKVLKRDQCIREVIKSASDRLLMVRPTDRSTGRGTAGSVVIKN
jgi:hypothetical protein